MKKGSLAIFTYKNDWQWYLLFASSPVILNSRFTFFEILNYPNKCPKIKCKVVIKLILKKTRNWDEGILNLVSLWLEFKGCLEYWESWGWIWDAACVWITVWQLWELIHNRKILNICQWGVIKNRCSVCPPGLFKGYDKLKHGSSKPTFLSILLNLFNVLLQCNSSFQYLQTWKLISPDINELSNYLMNYQSILTHRRVI